MHTVENVQLSSFYTLQCFVQSDIVLSEYVCICYWTTSIIILFHFILDL